MAAGIFGVALLTTCFFSPRFWLWPVVGMPLSELLAIQPEVHRAFYALNQLGHPWQRIDDPVNRVIEWRLLWPSLAHLLGLPGGLYLTLPHVGCLFALGTTAAIAWRTMRHALPVLAATLLAATSSWFFVSTGWLAYFDSWLVIALLLASFGRSRWTLFGAALLAPWVDERFILALPLCLAVRALAADRDTPVERRAFLRDAAMLIAGIAPYVAVRLGAEFSGSRATSGSYWTERPVVPAPWFAMVWGAWNGLRLGWVLVGCSLVAAVRARQQTTTWLVILGTLIVNLCVADDISRSASVALPALLAALLIAWRDRPTEARWLLPLLAAGNLLLPAQHVIGAAGTKERFHCVPILSLHAEYERTRNPPDFANPATYVRRSMDHFQNRALERAMVAAEIALRFDPSSAKAIANRAIVLYVMGGRRDEGLAELDRALAQAPELYEARMQRAAFRLEARDLRGALDDVRQALHFMPSDWPRRKEAEAFERQLAAQTTR